MTPITGVPHSVLDELEDVLGDFTLVGSFARDYWVHDVAGLPRGARTQDVDITILVSSLTEYRSKLASLDGPLGTGLAFRVGGWIVDVIPCGQDVAPDGILDVGDGVTLDVSGMAESAATGVVVPSECGSIRLPTLESMIGLKLVAWAYRQGSTQKDARDLGPLLTATMHGPFEDQLWNDDEAGARWSFDPLLMGPYRAGRDLRAAWRESSIDRALEALSATHRMELAARIARHNGGMPDVWLEQLDALGTGLRRD